jgi:predicted GNAT family acetyltransferase
MKPPGATEVSGVCTHPAHRGRGYAGGLMREVTRRILARGELAFLHVYASNTGAIALYQSLGFTLRREMTMMLLERE